MKLGKKFIIICLSILFTVSVSLANKSVFIISKHVSPSIAQAYKIDGSQVVLQGYVDISSYNQGLGAVGCATWPEKELIFFTYENSDTIVWSSTQTLKKVGEYTTNFSNCAGIVVDSNNSYIYVIKRDYPDLNVYSFDHIHNTLIFEGTYLLKKSSGYTIYGWGLALDEEEDLLYVSTNSNTVYVYDTNDFSYRHSIELDRKAVGIAVDADRGYMYSGYYVVSDWHDYLVRTKLTSPYDSIEVEIADGPESGPAVGVSTDEYTGYVYVTTQLNDFRVYDCNLNLLDTEENDGISGPAGVSIGGWYKEPLFSIIKDNNDTEDNCVEPFIGMGIDDNYLVFDIYWDANEHPDTNAFVIDYLPDSLDYHSSLPEADDYNSTDNTVTWFLGDISGTDYGYVQIETKVNEQSCPCGKITNIAVMEGDNYYSETAEDVNVCFWSGDIIYVDKDANGYNNGTSWDNAYTELSDALEAAGNCAGSFKSVWVAAGTYKPAYNTETGYEDKSFELVEGLGLFGHFAGGETNPKQRDFADANNTTTLDGQIGTSDWEQVYNVVTAQNVDDTLIDGFTIQSAYEDGIYIDDSNVGIINCKVRDNRVNGIYCTNFSELDIHNCLFIDNATYGLHVYENESNTIVSNSIFDGNDNAGCGLNFTSSSVELTDCNSKNHLDHGIRGNVGSLTIQGCSFEADGGVYNGAINISNVTATMVDITINNCNYGIYAWNSDLVITKSILSNNDSYGLQMYNAIEQNNLTLKGSVVRYNGGNGIRLTNNVAATIINNWIHNNTEAGILLNNPVSVPTIRNNTICSNSTYGLSADQYGADPKIINCIIYDNTSGDLYRDGGTFENVNYCCLQEEHSGEENFTGDPGFMNPTDPNDLHISENSPCKDKGDSNDILPDETDIDGEGRIKYGEVDIGADEYYWSPADFNENGKVDFVDYAILAKAWKCSLADANYNEECDLQDNNCIDLADLELFCADWLWERAWDDGWMMCMGGGGMDLIMSTGLMLDAEESLKARPERLISKSQKFYDIKASSTIPSGGEFSSVSIDENDIIEALNWLDGIWLDGQLKEAMTEEEFLKFRKAIEGDLMRLLSEGP